ncbi:MAG TPA: DUF3099 domain-containing protein [Streptosporangiaceae bacterium]|nr:DUF3099 domain-containing protein [Streptosporangiaceae bacterium]
MKPVSRSRHPQVALVTQAQPSLSADIAARQRRYLIMMGIRAACFALTIALFVAGAGWFAAIPAVGAIAIPYFAVVMANGGRELASTRGFQEYQPRLPDRYNLPNAAGWPGGTRPQDSGGPGAQPSQGFIGETAKENQPGKG